MTVTREEIESQPPVDAEEIREGTLLTVGVSSVVLSSEDEALGHTLLLDCDESDPFAVYRLGKKLDGVTALLESSPGSYHLWNLSVRELDEQLVTALRSPADAMHVQQSAKRGRFILRLCPKWRVDDEGRPTETYKEAPTLVDCWVRPTDRPQSRPHLQLLADRGAEIETDAVADQLVGSRVVRSEYFTMDDATKRRGL